MSLPSYIPEITSYLYNKGVPQEPEAAIILGSGLGAFGAQITDPIFIPYLSIPHFPATSVKGHEGKLIAGTLKEKHVIAFSGRFHHYEGFDFEQTVLPVFVAYALDTKKLIISNAAGAINTNFKVGDLMVVDDIILQNVNTSPRGGNLYRYDHYSSAEKVLTLAAEMGLSVQRGTYSYVKGPNYETKAEIRAFRIMGADAVGMSTAPELFEASRLKIKTAAVSLISNMASGVSEKKLNHNDVKEAAVARKNYFAKLIKILVQKF